MSNTRPINSPNRDTVQQSLAVDSRDYEHYRLSNDYVGVILNVYYSDDLHTYNAIRNVDHRGVFAECSVLCTTNSGTSLLLDHVRIPPPTPSGLADFREVLPRGSSNATDGSAYSESMTTVDPHKLDGDWCVVSFVGGNLDRPFISNWWQHPRNNMDPSTSGKGNPDPSGNPRSLDQTGRIFSRTRGVELLYTPDGDIYISTEFANSTLRFGEDAPQRGAWPKDTNPDVGGSVNVRLKSSQTLELDWNPSVEGIGINGGADPNLPQSNPKGVQQRPADPTFTTLFVSKEDLDLFVPVDLKIRSNTGITIVSEDTTRITGTNLLELEGTQVKVGANADQPLIRGEDLLQWLSNLTVLTATGPAKINPADITSFTNPLTGAAVQSTKSLVE